MENEEKKEEFISVGKAVMFEKTGRIRTESVLVKDDFAFMDGLYFNRGRIIVYGRDEQDARIKMKERSRRHYNAVIACAQEMLKKIPR